MKNLIIIIALFIGFVAFGQDTATKSEKTIKVFGNCGMCKDRIEAALDVKGVKFAEWNKETKMLKVIFNPQVITLEQINQKVAAVGHDTETVKAKDEVYNKLHFCCQYR